MVFSCKHLHTPSPATAPGVSCTACGRPQNEEPRSPRGGALGTALGGSLGESLRARWFGLRESLTNTTRELKGRLSGGASSTRGFASPAPDPRPPPTPPAAVHAGCGPPQPQHRHLGP